VQTLLNSIIQTNEQMNDPPTPFNWLSTHYTFLSTSSVITP